jgi:hypothetical protein
VPLSDGASFLIAGLGIVPAWVLANTNPWRVDVIEIDPDLIRLTTRAARSCEEPGESWADDPRLHIHHADAYDWWPGNRRGCALHEMCCYRHRYLAILRQRSVSTDRQRSISITVTRTNPGRCLVCGVSTMSGRSSADAP